MWLAHAGVLLVAGLDDTDALGKNLPHEFGFFQGQAKPILLLVEGGLGESLRRWSNVNGVYAPRFPSDEVAISRGEAGSISSIIIDWVERLRKAQLL